MKTKQLTERIEASSSEGSSGISNLRFKLSQENQIGTLQIGRKTFAVNVIEMSLCQFSVLVDEKLAKKLKIGAKAGLQILDKDCRVVVKTKRELHQGQVQLELDQIEEVIRTESRKAIAFSRPNRVRVAGSDSLLPFAIAISVIVAIMILPSLGGRWGTSKVFSKTVEKTWKMAVDTFKR